MKKKMSELEFRMFVKELRELTEINHHTEARLAVVQEYGGKREIAAMEAILTLHMYLGWMPRWLSEIGDRLVNGALYGVAPEKKRQILAAL